MRKLFAIVALSSVTLAMTACAAPTESEQPSASEATAGLQITEETETTLVGSFVRGESVVSFEARLEAPVVRTKIVVNGATYEHAYDIPTATLEIDGHGNTVLAADATVLRQVERAFDKAGSPSKIREAMFRVIALMSAAPRGTTIMKKVIAPTAEAPEAERGYCDSDDGITYLCGCNTLGANCGKTFAGYEGSNPMYQAAGIAGSEGVDNQSYGKYVSGCTSTPAYTHEHEVCEYSRDSSYHGRVTWGVRCGWSASECEGRCGAGCPNSYNFYITKDCLDHDACLNNHPSAASTSTFGDCGNEFDRASGDFSSGTGSSFKNLCGSYMYGDWSR